MLFHINVFAFMAFATSIISFVAAFDVSANTNMVVYWGQGPDQKRLSHFCADPNIDVILIAFLNVFPDQSGGYPGSNFGNQCGKATYKNPDGTSSPLLSDCELIGPDIKTCQSLGKKVLLSLGGAIPSNQHINDDASAIKFADFLWRSFGPKKATKAVSTVPRPFGDAAVNGFDFDIESALVSGENSGDLSRGYATMINTLRTFYETEVEDYYISGAPQCITPDVHLANAIQNSWFDFLFVQFYNTPQCSARAYFDHTYGAYGGLATNISFSDWVNFVHSSSQNQQAKVYLGLPAAPNANVVYDSEMYLQADEANTLIEGLQCQYPNDFGGVMLFEATYSEDYAVGGKPYADVLKGFMVQSGGCGSTTPLMSSSLPVPLPTLMISSVVPTSIPTSYSIASVPPKISTGKFNATSPSAFSSLGFSGSIPSVSLTIIKPSISILPSYSHNASSSPLKIGTAPFPIKSGTAPYLLSSGTGLPNPIVSGTAPFPISSSTAPFPISSGTGAPLPMESGTAPYPIRSGTGVPFPIKSGTAPYPVGSGTGVSVPIKSGTAPYPTGSGTAPFPIISGNGPLPIKYSNAPYSIQPGTAPLPIGSGTAPLPIKSVTAPLPTRLGTAPITVKSSNASYPVQPGTVPIPIESGTAPYPNSSGTAPFPMGSGTALPIKSDTAPLPSMSGTARSLTSTGTIPGIIISGTAPKSIKTGTAPSIIKTGTAPSVSLTVVSPGVTSAVSKISSGLKSIASLSSKAPYPVSNNSSPASSAEETVTMTAEVTIISCGPGVPNCPSRSTLSSAPVVSARSSISTIPSLGPSPASSSPTLNVGSSISSVPSASTQDVVTTEIVTSFVTSCPVTLTATSGGSQVLQITTSTSTVYSTITSTICTKCIAPLTPVSIGTRPSYPVGPSSVSSSVAAPPTGTIPNSPVGPSSFTSPATPQATTQAVVTTVLTYTTLTTCPVTNTVTSGTSTALQVTSSISTIISTITSTICTQCVAPPTTVPSSASGPAAPPATTQAVVTTVVTYTTLITSPVTNTVTSGSGSTLQVTSSISTITGTLISTICTQCVPPVTQAPASGPTESKKPSEIATTTRSSASSPAKGNNSPVQPGNGPAISPVGSPASVGYQAPTPNSPANGNSSPVQPGLVPISSAVGPPASVGPQALSSPVSKGSKSPAGPGSNSLSGSTIVGPPVATNAANSPASVGQGSPAGSGSIASAPTSGSIISSQAPANDVPAISGVSSTAVVTLSIVPIPLNPTQTAQKSQTSSNAQSGSSAAFPANNGTLAAGASGSVSVKPSVSASPSKSRSASTSTIQSSSPGSTQTTLAFKGAGSQLRAGFLSIVAFAGAAVLVV